MGGYDRANLIRHVPEGHPGHGHPGSHSPLQESHSLPDHLGHTSQAGQAVFIVGRGLSGHQQDGLGQRVLNTRHLVDGQEILGEGLRRDVQLKLVAVEVVVDAVGRRGDPRGRLS
jgi:hypothetical protein